MLDLIGKYCKDCKVFTDNIEADAIQMIYSFVNHPMFEGSKIRIMPDVHAGKDIVVGFTSPFSEFVNPDHVGGDIGCSVSTAITNIPVNPENYAAIEARIRETVKFGMTVHDSSKYDQKEFYKYLQAKVIEARKDWPEMVFPIDINDRYLSEMIERVNISAHSFYHSIGSVGGGNHFVEIGVSPEGTYAFTVHCGSRHLGQKVWKYWHAQAGKEIGVANGYLTGESMKGYITDMVVCQAYAEYNHLIIRRLVFDAIINVSKVSGKILESIYTTHNYIDFSMKMIRKGAVSAKAGERLVIPFNMRDGLIICRGKGNGDWNCSAPHGAGRLLSRADAKALIDMDEYRESMKGIVSTSVGMGTIDESPMAYKDPKEIVRLIADTVEVEFFIKPVINLKASSSFDSRDELEMKD